MKSLMVMMFVSLVGLQAGTDSHVKLDGLKAERLFNALVGLSRDPAFFEEDTCYNGWFANELHAGGLFTRDIEVWASVYQGGQLISSRPSDGQEIISALSDAGVAFGPSKNIREINCTLFKGGIARCANESDDSKFLCLMTVQDAK